MKTITFIALSLTLLARGVFSQNCTHNEQFCCEPNLSVDEIVFSSPRNDRNVNYYPVNYLTNSWFDPMVVGKNEPFNFHLVVDTNNISQIIVTVDPIYQSVPKKLHRNNQPFTSLVLKDDGTQGDLVPNDSIFSIDNLTAHWDEAYLNAYGLPFSAIEFVFNDGTSQLYDFSFGRGFGVINRDSIPIPEVHVLPTLYAINGHVSESQYSQNVFNMAHPNRVAHYWGNYIHNFPDDRNFSIRAITHPHLTSGGTADYAKIKMTELGTHYGNNTFDNSAIHLSNSVLTGFIGVNVTDALFGSVAINHEILHQFAVYTGPVGMGASHWGVVKFPSSGFGSGIQVTHLEQINDSIWHAWRDLSYTSRYNSLELYLMGLLPSDSIEFPFEALINPQWLGYSGNKRVYKADGLLVVDSAHFFNYMTERVPAYPDAPNEFNAVLGVVSHRLLTPTEMAFYDFLMAEYSKNSPSVLGLNFFDATGGRGSIVTAIPEPTYLDVDFTADPTIGNAPLEVQFTNQSVPGTQPIVSYLWDFGDGNTSTEENPIHIYSSPGTYNVTLTAYQQYAYRALEKQEFIEAVYQAPAANFSAVPTSGYAPLEVQFTDLSTQGTYPIVSWLWDFGDGNNSSEQNPTHNYLNPSNYTVVLIISDGSSNDTIELVNYINVIPALSPSAEFIANPTSGYAPLGVQFTDASTPGTYPILSWFWDLGDGNTSSLQSPFHIYSDPGNYSVSLIVSDGTLSDTLEIENLINASYAFPTANFQATPTSGYAPLGVQFTESSIPGTYPINTWFWDFGDGNTSSLQNPFHVYSDPGNYSVSLIVYDGTSSDTLVIENLINLEYALPNANFVANPTSGYVPLEVVFSDQSTSGTYPINSWHWDFGDSNSSNLQNPSHTYEDPGSYNVTLIVSDGISSDSLEINNFITAIPITNPIAYFSAHPTNGYIPLQVQFNDLSSPGSSPISNWFWQFGDGNTSTLQHPLHTYLSSGIYDVSLSVSAGEFADSITMHNLINSFVPLTVDAGPDQSITAGSTIYVEGTLIGGSGVYEYQWAPQTLFVFPDSLATSTYPIGSDTTLILTVFDLIVGHSEMDSLRVSTMVGFNEIDNKVQFRVYPNPFRDKLFIYFKSDLNFCQTFNLSIFDINGKVLFYQEGFNSSNLIMIDDFGHLQSGNYILSVKSYCFSRQFELIHIK